MNKTSITMVTLRKASENIGLSTKTLRDRACDGWYPSTVIRKIQGHWMVDVEEWNRWHKMQN